MRQPCEQALERSWLAHSFLSPALSSQVWAAKNGQAVRSLTGHVGRVAAVAVSGNGRWLASCADDGTLRVWDVTSGLVAAVMDGHTDAVRCPGAVCRCCCDSSVCAVTCVYGILLGACLVTAQPGRAIRHCSNARRSSNAPRLRQRAVTVTVAASQHPWYSRSALWAFPIAPQVAQLRFSPDAHFIASASADGTLRVWDTATGEQAALFAVGPCCHVAGLAYGGSSGRWLASADTDGGVRLWDTRNAQPAAVLQVWSQAID